MFRQAATILEAGYGGVLHPDRDLWGPDFTPEDLERLYEQRPRGDGRSVAVAERIAKTLLYTPSAKVLLSGQKGAGKSTELRRVMEDKRIRERFQPVVMVASQRLDLFQSTDAHYFLLSIAATIAGDIAAYPSGGKVLDWKKRAGSDLSKLIELLSDLAGVKAPSKFGDEQGFRLSLKGYVEWVGKLKSNEALRRDLVKDERYSVGRAAALVAELLGVLRWIAERDLLLVIDDGDKIAHEAAVRDIFLTNASRLLSLPCACVITFPFWFGFVPDFQPVQAQAAQVVRLENVKVVTRTDAEVVTEGSKTFFRGLYRRLVVEEGNDWLPNDALNEAVRLSAGVPREFLRVLERGFRVADDEGATALTRRLIDQSAKELRREMFPATETEVTRRRLERVRLTRRLETVEDRLLLDALLVVELTNDEPWYDVHPLLAPAIDRLLEERARRLQITADGFTREWREGLLASLDE